MFDLLVDTKRKRLGLVMSLCAGLFLVLMIQDLSYVTGIFQASGTSALLENLDGSANCFYGRLFVFLLNSSLANLHSLLAITVEYIFVLLRSLTNLEWVLIIFTLFLLVSHHDRISRFFLGVLLAHFVLRLILALALTFVFARVLSTNDIALLLGGVHWIALVCMVVHAGLIVISGYYLYNVLRHVYLAAFLKKEEEKNTPTRV